MKEFTNLDDLFDYIQEGINETLQDEDILSEIKTDIREFIIDNMYKFKPYEYIRTKEFINSLTVETDVDADGLLEIKIYFDTNKIYAHPSPNGTKWNQHADIYMNDVSELIPLWIEEGTGKEGFNLYPRPPLHSLKMYKRLHGNDFKISFENKLKKNLKG